MLLLFYSSSTLRTTAYSCYNLWLAQDAPVADQVIPLPIRYQWDDYVVEFVTSDFVLTWKLETGGETRTEARVWMYTTMCRYSEGCEDKHLHSRINFAFATLMRPS